MAPWSKNLSQYATDFGNMGELRAGDSKYARLRARLLAFLAAHPREKVILFSYFRPTLAYLRERLDQRRNLASSCRAATRDKDGVIAEFQSSGGPSVLLSSEVGSEGIDLQFAWVVVNYNLPWNPMRVEQRIGRVDRIGQASPKVVIWNLFYDQTIDSRIYDRLFRRLRIFEEALGALEPILVVSSAPLRSTFSDSSSRRTRSAIPSIKLPRPSRIRGSTRKGSSRTRRTSSPTATTSSIRSRQHVN